MRRLSLLLLLFVLALPTLALAARSAPGDGSLVVSDAGGTIIVQGKGLIFGHFDRGSVTVLLYKADGNAAPSVSGAKMKPVDRNLNVVYSGNDIRFLFPGGKYMLRFDGVGIDISAVGKGTVQVSGRGSPAEGSFAVNGGRPQSLTSVLAAASYGGVANANAEKGNGASGRSS